MTLLTPRLIRHLQRSGHQTSFRHLTLSLILRLRHQINRPFHWQHRYQRVRLSLPVNLDPSLVAFYALLTSKQNHLR